MKLQLEKELKEFGNLKYWYRVTVDDKYIDGSYDRELMQQLFDKIKADPTWLNNEKEILKCEEI